MKMIYSILFLSLLFCQNGFAEMAAKQRPLTNEEIGEQLTNPHPPKTDAEKKRVAFAELVIEKLLKSKPSFVHTKKDDVSTSTIYRAPEVKLNLTQGCLENQSCLTQNLELQTHLTKIHNFAGQLVEYKNTHLIPWAYQDFLNHKKTIVNSESKGNFSPSVHSDTARVVGNAPMTPTLAKDEYMVHVHVFMANQKWYHLNVILSEDETGNLLFRRFYMYEVPRYNRHSMPDGVVC